MAKLQDRLYQFSVGQRVKLKDSHKWGYITGRRIALFDLKQRILFRPTPVYSIDLHSSFGWFENIGYANHDTSDIAFLSKEFKYGTVDLPEKKIEANKLKEDESLASENGESSRDDFTSSVQ